MGEVQSEDALISSVNREMEEERQRLLNKAQSVAQEVQQRVTVGDMEAVVGAAVETMQSELQAAQQRTRQLLIQVRRSQSVCFCCSGGDAIRGAGSTAAHPTAPHTGSGGVAEGGRGVGEGTVFHVCPDDVIYAVLAFVL
ncbi:unnamed protein product [Closterium sp. NIES-53]